MKRSLNQSPYLGGKKEVENSGDGGKEDNQNSIGAKRWGREGKEVTDP